MGNKIMIKTVIRHDDNYYYDVIRRNLKKYEQKKRFTQDMLGEMTNIDNIFVILKIKIEINTLLSLLLVELLIL